MTEIETLFRAGGPLAAAAGDRYEVREGQIAMAQAVARRFDDGGVLLVEAPTGTGKSVAYLVPAILRVPERLRTVVVTANIALQEQLVTKDLPALQKVLGVEFKFALAKGISNFLCLASFDDALGDRAFGAAPGERAEWDPLMAWASTTAAGDLSELSVELSPRLRAAVTTTTDDCPGKKCRRYADCWAMAARRRYACADVIVTNYHLFFVDLAIKRADGNGVFPPYDLVVLDEAHQAADIARDFFGSRVTHSAIKWALRPLPPEDRADLERDSERFFRSLAGRKKQRVTQSGELDGAAAIAAGLSAAAERMEDLAGRELVEEVAAKTAQCARRARTASEALLRADAFEDPDQVVFVERPTTERGLPAVCAKPIRVAPLLAEALFDARPPRAIVATSATLTAGGEFDFMTQELGAFEAGTLQVPSPFDHRGAALLVVPTDLPDPRNGEFAGRVAEVLVETVRAARGRTLGLFTSYRVLDEAHRALLAARLPYRVLRQGEAPRTRLIEQFRDDVSSVLLGTSSFWEGIDVQGESLTAVLIDRLPFDHPEDPVLEAISERDRGWFMRYSLPRAIISFRQGFGRLIRSRTDRGVIVVCDRRIVDKPYGSRFVRSLPVGVRLVRSLDAAEEVLR